MNNIVFVNETSDFSKKFIFLVDLDEFQNFDCNINTIIPKCLLS